MCKISDLKVLIVEKSEESLKIACDAIIKIGITTVVCVKDFGEAMVIIERDSDLDMVIADADIDNLTDTGIFLCEMAKKTRPGLLFLLLSKTSGMSFIGQALYAGADATMDYYDKPGVEDTLNRWLSYARLSREVKDMINQK